MRTRVMVIKESRGTAASIAGLAVGGSVAKAKARSPSLREGVDPGAGAREQNLHIAPRGQEKEALSCSEPGLLRGIGRESRNLAGIPAGIQDASDRLLVALVSLRISRVKSQ
jgi:hypothetical protein